MNLTKWMRCLFSVLIFYFHLNLVCIRCFHLCPTCRPDSHSITRLKRFLTNDIPYKAARSFMIGCWYRLRILTSSTELNLVHCRIRTVLTVVLALICLIAFAGCPMCFLLVRYFRMCHLLAVHCWWIFNLYGACFLNLQIHLPLSFGCFFPFAADCHICFLFAAVVAVFSWLLPNFLFDDSVFIWCCQFLHLFFACCILFTVAA